MKFVTEHLINSQDLLGEIFSYIGTNYPDQKARIRSDPDGWQPFFKAWGGEDPFHQIKVFTMREESDGEIKGCVVVLISKNPLFIERPHFDWLVDISHGNQAFKTYIETVLEGA